MPDLQAEFHGLGGSADAVVAAVRAAGEPYPHQV
jgi:homoserine kinase